MESEEESETETDIEEVDFEVFQKGLRPSKEESSTTLLSNLKKILVEGVTEISLIWSFEECLLDKVNEDCVKELTDFLESRGFNLMKTKFLLLGKYFWFDRESVDVVNNCGLLNRVEDKDTLKQLSNSGCDWFENGFPIRFTADTNRLLSSRMEISSSKETSLEQIVKAALFEVTKKNLNESEKNVANFWIGCFMFRKCINHFPRNLDIWFLYFHFLLQHWEIYKSDKDLQLIIGIKIFVHSQLLFNLLKKESTQAIQNTGRLLFMSFSYLACIFKDLEENNKWKSVLRAEIKKRSLSLELLLQQALSKSENSSKETLFFLEIYVSSYVKYFTKDTNFLELIDPIINYVLGEITRLNISDKEKFEKQIQIRMLLYQKLRCDTPQYSFNTLLQDLAEPYEYLSALKHALSNGMHQLYLKIAFQGLNKLTDDFTGQRIIANKLLWYQMFSREEHDVFFKARIVIGNLFIRNYRFSCFQAKKSRAIKLKATGFEIVRLLETLPGKHRNKLKATGFKRKASNSGIKYEEEKQFKANSGKVTKIEVAKKRKFFLFNLDYKVEDQELRDFLLDIGVTPSKVQVLKGRNRGQAILEIPGESMDTLDSLTAVFKGKLFKGRTVNIGPFLSKTKRKMLAKEVQPEKLLKANRIVVKKALPATISALENLTFSSDPVAEELSALAPIQDVKVAPNRATVFIDYNNETCAKKIIHFYDQKFLARGEGIKVELFGGRRTGPFQTVSFKPKSRKQLLRDPALRKHTVATGKKSNDFFKSLLAKGK